MSREITGSCGILGVAGNPVGHSLSPIFQNYVLEKQGLDYVYLPFAVERGKFREFIRSMRCVNNFRGLNITIPFKEDACRCSDRLSPEAELTGSVNTIMLEDGRIYGYNTDIEGILTSLKMQLGISALNGRHAVVLGAGGAARAAMAALDMLGVGNVYVVNRTKERANAVKRWAKSSLKCGVEVVSWNALGAVCKDGTAALLVNATPLGLKDERLPLPYRNMGAGCAVFDMVYRPGQTRLVREARGNGLNAVDGFYMLIYQGLKSFSVWTGKTVKPGPVIAFLKRKTG